MPKKLIKMDVLLIGGSIVVAFFYQMIMLSKKLDNWVMLWVLGILLIIYLIVRQISFMQHRARKDTSVKEVYIQDDKFKTEAET